MISNLVKVNKSRLGGLKRIELFGNPGTDEGRSKGGRKTIALFRNNPDLARKAGFIIRKEIKYPVRCGELAELIGIILGDGGLSGNHQVVISLNSKTDKEYSVFVGSLLKKLFSIDSHFCARRNCNGMNIVVSSSNLVDFLLKQGLVAGNKVRNQVDIPKWIYSKSEYQIACLRGLIDTDGSFYSHKYISNKINYNYLKLCFASRSKPLLNSVSGILRRLDFDAYLHGDQVFIYSKLGIKKYFKEIGSHNLKHSNKICKFLES